MTHTNPEFLYELKIAVAALMRACYEVIGACSQIEYSIRLLDKNPGEASAARCAPSPVSDGAVTLTTAADRNPPFTPAKKPPTTKGDPLAELAAQMSPGDREKLIAVMEGKK